MFDGKRISIKAIVSIVLPTQILDFFLVVGVEQAATEIESSLDELPDTELTDDIHFESRGFMEPSCYRISYKESIGTSQPIVKLIINPVN